jgi:hypothetical protein
MSSAGRLALFFLVAIALSLAAVDATRVGASDSLVYAASVEMNAWSASGNAPGTPTWEWVREDLQSAVRATDRSPSAQELLGVLYGRRTDHPEYVPKAIVHLYRALELRPTSPYTWASVAQLKYFQGDTGRDFTYALERAAALGPSEPEVQRVVADYGLAVWDEAQASTRDAITRVVSTGMLRNPKEMLQIADRRGRLGVACRLLPSEPRTLDFKWSQLCQGTESTS